MNRIRKYGDKWQVLVTPYQQYNNSFEILRGFWTDEHIHNYNIEDFDTLNDAQGRAFEMPDIEWVKLIIMYKNAYHDIQKSIKHILDKNEYIVQFESKYMDPEMAKEAMFNRVMNNGRRFSLIKNMNDIISFHVINPWSVNIKEISDVLIKNKHLNIIKFYINNNMIHLIGKTDFGMTYEIGLWPTVLYNWSCWSKMHTEINNDVRINSLNEMIKTQKIIDNGYVIR